MKTQYVTTVALFLGFALQTLAAERPNVLLICVDDLKPALGCYGDELAKTPNIDALAGRGIRFERAYCNQAVCSPSMRNALLASLRPQSLGIYDLATNFRVAAPDAVTLPQYFKDHGYRTEGLGKIFHRGHGNGEDGKSWSVPHWKSDVVAYGLKENNPKGQTREAALFDNVSGEKAKKLPRGPAYESADVPDNKYPDGQVADEAIKRLENASKTPNEPFFLAVGFVKPHLPFCAPKKYWDMHDASKFKLAELRKAPTGAPSYAPTKSGELRNYSNVPDKGPVPDDTARALIHGYYAAASYMDAQVGRVLDALEKYGLAKNTIVVLWGDHGWHLGDHGMWCKHTNYEQATRIPLIVVDPRGKSSESHSAALVESVDVYPTLCELAGLDVPNGLEGKSFTAVIKDPSTQTKDAVLHVYPRGKVIGRAVRTSRYRLVEWKEPGASRDTAELELYDYETDPGESKNLADEKPEVVNELRAILDKQPEAQAQIQSEKSAANKKAGQQKRAKKQRRAQAQRAAS